jgi:transcriptional regulator with XRE-family HTH domain
MENIAAIINGSFGQKLSRVRKNRGFSQSELGSRIGVSRTTIANLENGKQNVQLYQVFVLARALDAPVEMLLPTGRELHQDNDAIRDKDQVFLAIARMKLSDELGGANNE